MKGSDNISSMKLNTGPAKISADNRETISNPSAMAKKCKIEMYNLSNPTFLFSELIKNTYSGVNTSTINASSMKKIYN